MKISSDIFFSYLKCKYKAYLIHNRRIGKLTGFEKHLKEMNQKIYLQYIETPTAVGILKDKSHETGRLPIGLLKQGYDIITKLQINHGDLFAKPVSLEKVSIPSIFGDFSYTTSLIVPNHKIFKPDRLLLAYNCYVLGKIQNRMPESGIIIIGNPSKKKKVKVKNLVPDVEYIINEIHESLLADQSTKLILNDLCLSCEFRTYCHKIAKKDNHLSLLRTLKN